jgi:DNA invertase Pin-like site-specific DNA recombinase
MTKAYSYLRWSDARQGRGDTEDRQLSSAREYAANHGLELDTSLVDRGVSGYTGANRTKGNLGRFLAMVHDGVVKEGEYLLVDSMDRLSRLPLNEAAAQLLSLANAGVVVVTMNDGMKFDRNVDISTMIHAVLKMQGATDYSKELGRKVARGHKTAKRKAREEGRIYSLTGPGWLVLNDEFGEPARRRDGLGSLQDTEGRAGWAKVPDRVRLVQQVFDWADHGGLGQRVIANRLNAAGEKPFRHGTGWHEVAIQKLLKNRMVLGEYQPRFKDSSPDGDPIEGYYGKGVIEPAQFYRVQTRFGVSPAKGRRNGPDKLNNMFQGICRCAECGSTVGVAVRSKDKRPLFICRNTAPGMKCENRNRYRVAEFEDAVLAHLTDVDLSENRATPERAELETALADHAALQVRIHRFVANMERSDWTPDDFTAAHREKLMEQIRALSAVIQGLRTATKGAQARLKPAKHQEVLRDYRDKLRSLTGTELYDARAKLSAALRAIIDRVSFGYDPFGEKTISVWVLGGAKVYVFRPDMTNIYNFVDSILAEDDPDLIASYTQGDARREAKLRSMFA